MLLPLLALLPIVQAAYDVFDAPTYTANTTDGQNVLIDTTNFKTWLVEERRYFGQWIPDPKLEAETVPNGQDMVDIWRDESGDYMGLYDGSTGEIKDNENVIGHANDTGFFDASGIRRGLAINNETRLFYAPDQSFIGGVFHEPKKGPGSNGYDYAAFEKDYKVDAALFGPKAGIVRDLSGFLAPRTRLYFRDRRYHNGAELVHIRNNTMDTLQIEDFYTFQQPLSRISFNYTMNIDTGVFNFDSDEGEASIDYASGNVSANGAVWGDFLKQTGLQPEEAAEKSDLELHGNPNVTFTGSDGSPIGGISDLDTILDKNGNLLYKINADDFSVTDASGKSVGQFNNTDYTIWSSDKKNKLGQIVLKGTEVSGSSSVAGSASSTGSASKTSSGSSAAATASGSAKSTASASASGQANGASIPTGAAAALVVPFILLMI